MNHTEILTRYTGNFVDELVKSGLRDVVISPGSRSTPLAMMMYEHEEIEEWVIVDERSAAYFALGLAKQTGRAVALLCTSGTAAANYYPAIIEAHYGRVPLLVLTADRPHELRDIGAPQAIDQMNMYGDYVKWFEEMALPEASPRMLAYSRTKAARAVFVAESGNAGPVHLNFPFREPLLPDFSIEDPWGRENKQSNNPVYNGVKTLTEEQLHYFLSLLKDKEKGVIVCGPQVDRQLGQSVAKLAAAFGLPILADPLSQLRSGPHSKEQIIEGYDAIFRNQTIREYLKPDYIIRFGAMPVSKSYLFYVEEHQDALQFIIEPDEGFRDPTGNQTEYIYADPHNLCADLISSDHQIRDNHMWLETWQKMNQIAKDHLLSETAGAITEGEAVKHLLDVIPQTSILYVGNSMAIRDVDTFFMSTEKELTVLANRGASGIDGVVSSALGATATTNERVTLLIGDLSFYHDLNGLLTAKQYGLDLTIVLINNNGGGIFSFLPQAKEEKYFDVLFGTPLDIEFSQAVSMYGGHYELVTDEADLREKLTASYDRNGLTVIEVQTDRTANVNWHREKWAKIELELLEKKW
ncbi:MAG TPA: 2-succinyl-5-enolpyruvyl-6-hydroxy-3-cyclohexene-1-carboxylic-acid synthase [Virgibacillus sp.]|nr:2-succinyl-5-enolpyruvyl-6-hydroxy-3-cyclohexene-1-carboxylic-acid synthase [Virgibacillus sp.]